MASAAVAGGGGTGKGGAPLTDQQMDDFIRNEDASFDHN
jgi:hypothetical protein